MKREILESLECHLCHSTIAPIDVIEEKNDEIVHAIAGCKCNTYPISYGILNLGGKWAVGMDRAVAYLEKGQVEKACASQIEVESLSGKGTFRLLRKLASRDLPLSTAALSLYRNRRSRPVLESKTFQEALEVCGVGDFQEYLMNRYVLPSCYKTLPVFCLLQQVPHRLVLDLGAGAGHFTHILERMFPESTIVAVDQHFYYLLLAKRYLAPNASYICMNLGNVKPFHGKFDIVFCSDMLHTQKNRKTIIDYYLKRLSDEGMFVAPRLDHSWDKEYQLSLNQWSELFASSFHHFFSEETIQVLFAEEDRVSLGESLVTCTDGVRALLLIASIRPQNYMLTFENLSELLKNTLRFSVNPLYEEMSRNDDSVGYFLVDDRMSIHCSEWQEHRRKYLPDRITLPKDCVLGGRILNDCEHLPQMIRDGTVIIEPIHYTDTPQIHDHEAR